MAELPAGVEVKESTRALLRRASQEFHEDNPYVPMAKDGVVYSPPERKIKHVDKAEKKDDADSDEETIAATTTGAPTTAEPSSAGEEEEPKTHRLKEIDYSVPWHAILVSDDFRSPKHTLPNGKLKPRRPIPHITASDFLAGIKKEDGTYFFPKMLNEWPALQGLLLVAITQATDGWGGTTVNRLWTAQEGKEGKKLPEASVLAKNCRATFWAPSWAQIGWTPTSPGFVYWYSEMYDGGKARLISGEDMLQTLRNDANFRASVTDIHVYVHRYPKAVESFADKQTYHAVCVLEWEHKEFVTVCELAFLNAVGGYGGKANWIEDKIAPRTKLFELMNETPGMVVPWNEHMSEIRMYDIKAKNMEELEAYMHKYSNKMEGLPQGEQRFLEWERYASSKIKMRYLNSEMLVGFFINYIRRVWGYRRIQYNCQTFSTDLFCFLTGDRNHKAYSSHLLVYTQHMLSFIYTPKDGHEYPDLNPATERPRPQA